VESWNNHGSLQQIDKVKSVDIHDADKYLNDSKEKWVIVGASLALGRVSPHKVAGVLPKTSAKQAASGIGQIHLDTEQNALRQ